MPATIGLTDLLDLEDVHVEFQAASVIDAVPILLRPALTRRGIAPQAIEDVLNAVTRREHETATICGSLVLPHARCADVHDFVFAIGANASGVVAGSPEPRLILAFVSPDQKREQHLQLLASLARLSQNAPVVSEIAGAGTAEQIIDALRAAGV